MASHDIDWTPGALVHFGSLEFIVTGSRGLSRIEAPAPPRRNHTFAVSASAELVGMVGYDSDVDASGHHPSRECMMVEVGGTSNADGAGVGNDEIPSATVTAAVARPAVGATPPPKVAIAGVVARTLPLPAVAGRRETPPGSPMPGEEDDLEQLLQRQREVAETERQLKDERERLECEVARRRAQREQARVRGREAQRRILDDANQLVPRYTRPSQNVAAAATLLRALPQPANEDQRRIQEEVMDLLDLAAVQQAEREQSSAVRRRESSASHRTPSRRREQPETSARPTAEQSETDEAPVRRRIGESRDARDTLTARRREQNRGPRREAEDHGYAPRRGGRFDPEEDKPPVLTGPKAFGPAIRRAPVPQRFRPPGSVVKYNGETNPALWLEDYRLACQAGGATDERFIIRNLPLFLADSARTWLEHLPEGSICNWRDLEEVFIGNFQGTYTRPGNPWDLRNCRQRADESLRDYVKRFSRKCHALPNLAAAEVISAFIAGTNNEALVHDLGRNSPRTVKELLDVATSHASGQDAVDALLHRVKGKTKRNESSGAGPSAPHDKKQKQGRGDGHQRRDTNFVATAERKQKKPVADNNGNKGQHFEKMLEASCPNHGRPVNHALKDCGLLLKFLGSKARKSDPKSPGPRNDDDNDKEAGDGFPQTTGCLMIFGGGGVGSSRRHQKQERREVYAAEPPTPTYLKWSGTAITYDRNDHPERVLRPGRYPLVVDPIVSDKRLTKVLMDGGSGLNVLYAETLDAMGISRARIQPSGEPFYGVVPGKTAVPLGQIDLPVTFGTPINYRTETLTFDVVDFPGSYHAILGRPCYAKFMAIPNYIYLKLKMPGPRGVITVSTSLQRAYECEVENCALAAALINKADLPQVATLESGDTPTPKKTAGSFEPSKDTKTVPLDLADPEGEKVTIGTTLSDK